MYTTNVKSLFSRKCRIHEWLSSPSDDDDDDADATFTPFIVVKNVILIYLRIWVQNSQKRFANKKLAHSE